jgi:large subunit ribosomal protein L29
MTPQDLRKLTPEELDARVRDLRDSLFNLKVKHETGQLDDVAGLGRSRRDLARALTIQTERRRVG